MLIAFLQQLLSYQGYYDKNLDWIGLESIQVVISVSSAPGAERFTLPSRFLSLLKAIVVETPSEDELASSYACYLTPILEEAIGSQARVEGLAANMVRVFEQIRQIFRAGDQVHYAFSPLDLTTWVVSLMRYQFSSKFAGVHRTGHHTGHYVQHQAHFLKALHRASNLTPAGAPRCAPVRCGANTGC